MVDRVREALAERRVGHTGTLDPFATGVLPVCVGKATRLARFLAAGEKAYRATVRLGVSTTTDDVTGEPLGPPRAVGVDDDALGRALSSLVGTYEQRAPAFSAKRIQGRRAYELARAGAAAPPVLARVTVHALTVLERAGDTVVLDVRCSSGTYVRAIARDLGEALGTGAHLAALRRTESGGFREGDAVLLEAVATRGVDALLPMERLLTAVPAVVLNEEGLAAVRHGRVVSRDLAASGFPTQPLDRVRLLDAAGRLVALAVPRGFDPPPAGLRWEPALHPDIVLA